MRRHSYWQLAALVALGLSVADGAEAQGKKAGKHAADAAAPALDAADLGTKLKGTDPEAIKSALAQARMAGKAAAVMTPAIEDVLRRGTSVELATAALATLADIGEVTSSAAIRPYARHRKIELRRAAVKALLKTGGAEAIAGLREALSDGDAMVRGIAASGLGTLKAKDALADLFLALDHKVNEAAASIGQLCGKDDCEKLAGKLGVLNFDIMTSGLDQILFRSGGDLGDDEKIRIVGRLRELGTADANKYLRDVQSRWPSGGSARVKQAIDQAVLATGGGAGGKP